MLINIINLCYLMQPYYTVFLNYKIAYKDVLKSCLKSTLTFN